MHVWSSYCGTTQGDHPSPEFRSVYPHFTTVQGNRFRFRDGDPVLMRETMQRMFEKSLDGSPIRTHVDD